MSNTAVAELCHNLFLILLFREPASHPQRGELLTPSQAATAVVSHVQEAHMSNMTGLGIQQTKTK